MTKKEIRQQIKDEKSKLTVDEINQYSSRVTDQLINSKQYEESAVVYIYLSFNQELQTNAIIERAFQDNKKVAVPRIDSINNLDTEPSIDCLKSKKEMNFYYIDSKEELSTGFYGILEPSTNWKAEDKKALMIMPGLAFDKSFSRIGYGGGYYDEYLLRHAQNKFIKIALAYDFQLFEELPYEEYDVKVDQIITPTLHIKKFSN